jgi:hypothetical protein
LEDAESLFMAGFTWTDNILEPVDTNFDTGSTLSLQWYQVLPSLYVFDDNYAGFPVPYMDKRTDATFQCGICNSITSPCAYG